MRSIADAIRKDAPIDVQISESMYRSPAKLAETAKAKNVPTIPRRREACPILVLNRPYLHIGMLASVAGFSYSSIT
jgi:hypothetical protein